MMLRNALSGALLLCAVTLPAMGDEAEPPVGTIADVSGEWSFVAQTDDDCSFTGVALLTRTENPNKFDCELTALQVCTVETWQVRQSCTANRLGDQLIITSQIEEFIQGAETGAYMRDNFSLKIKSADLMRGVLLSWGSHVAVFRRSEGVIG